MRIAITKQDLVWVAEQGRLRTEENAGTPDIAAYDHKRFNLTSLQANRMGVLAEFVVYKPLALRFGWDLYNPDPAVWAAFVKKADYASIKTPDIMGVAEVRRANKEYSPIPIRPKDVEAGAYIIQPFIPYTQQERYGAIRIQTEGIKILGWTEARKSYESFASHVPDWSKDGKDRITNIKQPWNTFPMEVFAA